MSVSATFPQPADGGGALFSANIGHHRRTRLRTDVAADAGRLKLPWLTRIEYATFSPIGGHSCFEVTSCEKRLSERLTFLNLYLTTIRTRHPEIDFQYLLNLLTTPYILRSIHRSKHKHGGPFRGSRKVHLHAGASQRLNIIRAKGSPTCAPIQGHGGRSALVHS